METNFIQTDGGRSAAGYHFETDDCAVRSLAVVCGVEYRKAHNLLKRWGRRNGKPFALCAFLCRRNVLNTENEWMPFGIRRGIRVNDFLQLYPQGSYIVYVRAHVFAVIDGVLYDEARELAGNQIIFSAFKFNKSLDN